MSKNFIKGKDNLGWADSITQVLNSNKSKSTQKIVLSKAKKFKLNKPKETYNFQIDGNSVNQNKKSIEATQNKDFVTGNSKKPKRNSLKLRIKTEFVDRENEKILKKLATRGVVQLFNAVRMQQKDIEQKVKEAGSLDHRKDEVLNNINKAKFLDILMSGSRSKLQLSDKSIKKEESVDGSHTAREAQWDILREDFMTNKKIKHWDQEENQSSTSSTSS